MSHDDLDLALPLNPYLPMSSSIAEPEDYVQCQGHPFGSLFVFPCPVQMAHKCNEFGLRRTWQSGAQTPSGCEPVSCYQLNCQDQQRCWWRVRVTLSGAWQKKRINLAPRPAVKAGECIVAHPNNLLLVPLPGEERPNGIWRRCSHNVSEQR